MNIVYFGKILSFRTRHIIKVDIELEWRKFRMGYNLNFFSFPEKIPILYEQAVPYLGTYIDNNGYADILHSKHSITSSIDNMQILCIYI